MFFQETDHCQLEQYEIIDPRSSVISQAQLLRPYINLINTKTVSCKILRIMLIKLINDHRKACATICKNAFLK